MLSETEHESIASAIKAAEARTSGEIHCVVCGRSDPYFMAAAFVLSCVALMLGTALAWIFHLLWIDIGTATFVTALFCAWLLSMLLIWQVPSLRLRFVAKAVRYRRAHAQAVQQFLAHNIHATEGRTGVLIFVSLDEHYAEIIADHGIAEKIEQQEWNSIVGIITKGAAANKLAGALAEAVTEAGALLAAHYPPVPGDRNEIPDRVVEIHSVP
ncbi:TPM domain-containing protein [Hoeflea sp.]|uniref:TPM domain-containing protein n=1 Tax=Hoeflea sp. TaxID=1940281 RepID=UPI003B02BBE0